jgi:2-keto-myo-inositol isomerase
MRPCLNVVTLGRGFDPLTAIRISAEAGFKSVGLWADALLLHQRQYGSLRLVERSLQDNGVQAEEICFVGGWMWVDNKARREVMLNAWTIAEMAGYLGAPYVIGCVSGGAGDPQIAAEDLFALCEVGRQFNVHVAVEYIGGVEQYKGVASALELTRACGHPGAQLLMDVFHTFKGGGTAADFLLPKGGEIGLIHINDVPDGDIPAMNDSHRVLPGEGILPLSKIVDNLKSVGFDGALSVEIFNEAVWALPPEEIAARAKASLDGLLGA